MVIPDVLVALPPPKVTPVGSRIAMAHSITLTGIEVLAHLPLTFLGGLVAFSDPFLYNRILFGQSPHEVVRISSINKRTCKFV